MEDSFKGLIITFGFISLFITAMLNFIILFPQEQGFTVTSDADNQTYLVLSGLASDYSTSSIDEVQSSLNTGYNEWDLEVGYMGSNTQKASKETGDSYISSVTSGLSDIAYEVFTTGDGSTHPVIYVLGFTFVLLGIYSLIVFVKFLRTGY